MFKKLYDKTLELAAHPRAGTALFGVSFAESSFFPIPPDVMLIPMVLAERTKAWAYATICTLGSVIGGAAGYAIGFFLFESLGTAVLNFYGYMEKFTKFADTYNEQGIWIVLAAGLTPLPYKIFTIASGLTQMNIFAFIGASIVARGIRFFAVSGLLYWFGAPIREFIEKRFGLVVSLFFILLVGGFILLKYLV